MIETVNEFLLKNELVKMFIVIILSVFAGYTLQPMPPALLNLFMNSQIFKLLVLVTLFSVSSLPLTKEKFLNIVIASVVVLVLFETLRRY